MTNLYPKKNLGQNFLTAPFVVKEMVAQANITKKDTVLEIGGGKGVLTEKLLETGASVLCVEKDERMVSYLKELCAKKKNGVIMQGDILSFDPSFHFKKKAYKIVANIPYNITGAILSHFLEQKKQPKYMLLMVQKEVAKRVCANDQKESLLSISVKAYGTPKLIRTVGAGAFFPKPKVDSAVLEIKDISKSFFTSSNLPEKFFFSVVKAGFAHKRKKLVSNLSSIIKKESVVEVFKKSGISEDARAENIPMKQWFTIVLGLYRLSK